MKSLLVVMTMIVTSSCGSVGKDVVDGAVETPADASPGDGAAATTPGQIIWARSTSAFDPLGVQVGTGGIVITGQFNAPATLGAGAPMVPTGDYDMAVVGISPDDASVLYATHFGDVGYEAGFIDTVAGGAPIIHGVTSGVINIGTGQLAAGGASDAFIGRYGPGPPSWLHRLATADDDKISATALGPAGTVYATGYFVGAATIDNVTLHGTGGRDALLARFNTATGVSDLVLAFGGTGRNEGTGVTWRNGATFLAGAFDGSMTLGAQTLTSAGSTDAFVARLDDTGAVQWAKSFGGIGFEAGPRIEVNSDGDIYIAGTFQNQIAFGAVNLVSAGSDDIYVAKLHGTDGSVAWATSIGSTASDNLINMAAGPNGEVCLNGTAGAALNIGGGNQGGLDAMIVCYDGDAKLRWKKLIGTINPDRGWGIAFASDGLLYATVTVGGPIDLGVPLIGAANPEGILLKLAP